MRGLSSRYNPLALPRVATPEQEATALENTRQLIATVLDMTRQSGLPDSAFGRVMDAYDEQLERVMCLAEMDGYAERERMISAIRAARGPKYRASDRGLVQDADGLDEMPMEDLRTLFERTNAIKPV